MDYPIGSGAVQLATSDQQSALITNSGEGTLYLYRSSSVSSTAYDMILPGGGASLQWPEKAELWAVTAPGTPSTVAQVLFTAGATFTPAPTKVTVVSGTTNIASNAVLTPEVPRIFDVSSAEYLYVDVSTRLGIDPMARTDGPSYRGLGSAINGEFPYTAMFEWGVLSGGEFKVFSSNTYTFYVNEWPAKGIKKAVAARKLTVAGPAVRVTLSPSARFIDGVVNLIAVSASVTVTESVGGGALNPSYNISVLDSRMGANKWMNIPVVGNVNFRLYTTKGSVISMSVQCVGNSGSGGGGNGTTNSLSFTTPQYSNIEACINYGALPSGEDIRVAFG